MAPKRVMFFDKDWQLVGDKRSLQSVLTSRTKINENFLLQYESISRASISQRMSWLSGRETTVPEDTAYCSLGLFGVNMPLLYGEGKERAFRRLQEEIMKYSNDHSLFAWKHQVAQNNGSGFFASDPDCFKETGKFMHKPDGNNNKPFQMTDYLEYLSGETQQYRRIRTDEFCKVPYNARGELKRIYIRPPDDI